MNIITDEEIKLKDGLNELLIKAAGECADAEGLDPERIEISLSIVSKEEIRQLNSQFRGVDSVTDVLSFPQYEDLEEAADDDIICLGDVVICDEVVKEQAFEFGHSEEREFVYLFVHSVLHLLGYDHMNAEEKEEMRTREEEVMDIVGLQRVI